MATKKKALQAAAGAAGGGALAIEDVFSTYLYTSNGSTQTITNGIDLAGEGGMVWIKSRSDAVNHVIVDTERVSGTTDNYLMTNLTNAQVAHQNEFGNFTSTGFTVPYNTEAGYTNFGTRTYVSWTFRKAPRFFDVVTFSTTYNTVPSTLTHTLDAPLGMAIFKRTDGTGNWVVWHKDLGTRTYLRLNDTSSAVSDPTYAPTYDEASKTFTFYYPMANVDDRIIVGNAETSNWVGYFFAHDPLGPSGDGSDGLIACGSFNSGGSAAYVDVDLGWEPQWVMFKSSSSAGDWYMFDTMRGIATGGNDQVLRANASSAESLFSGDYIDITSTGFRLTPTGWNSLVGPNVDLVYIAIRRGPMRQPESGTEVFAIDTADSTFPAFDTGFPVDLGINKYNNLATGWNWADRLRGPNILASNNSNAESSSAESKFDSNVGWRDGIAASNLYSWNFRRAPGFFDVTAYEGDGLSTSTFNHNLGVTPELMIIKNRDDIRDWCVYHKDLGATYLMNLNSTAAAYQSGSYFPADPTETVFRPGSASATNRLGYSHIAYHFATLPGVSKVGSYTGNGSSQTIDCGFTTGARFVLIKNYTTPDSWYVWDSARGIVAGNDPYLRLDTTGAEGTTDDWIDPDASGFALPVNNKTNENGTGYIYLAIA